MIPNFASSERPPSQSPNRYFSRNSWFSWAVGAGNGGLNKYFGYSPGRNGPRLLPRNVLCRGSGFGMSRDGHSKNGPEDRENPKSNVRAHRERLWVRPLLRVIQSAAAVPLADSLFQSCIHYAKPFH